MVSASVRLLRPGAYLANSFAAVSASLAVITTGLSSQTKQRARMSSCSPTKQLGLLRLFLSLRPTPPAESVTNGDSK